MIICGSGHRPDKLGGYDDEVFYKLTGLARHALEYMEATHVISGMALGWDQAIAHAAIKLGLPWVAAVPFKGQELAWPDAARDRYNSYIAKASKVIIVSEGGYAAWKMEARNQAMANQANRAAVLWNGTPGGTGNFIRYAKTCGLPCRNFWQEWEKGKW